MKYVAEILNRGPVRNTVLQELKHLGVKAPKCRKISMKKDVKTNGKVFGTPINHLPYVVVDEDKRMKIPTFLANILPHLEKGIEAEGLFRKAGSLIRQREIRQKVEKGQMDFESTPVYDLASLVKQFLRELPEPLIFTRLHDSFMKAQDLDSQEKRCRCIMLLILLLPVENIHLLRYVMSFLKRLASFSDKNKMDIYNLSLIMAPNLMQFNDKTSRILQSQTRIISTLIENAEEIGFVPSIILDKMSIEATMDELSGNSSVSKYKRRNSLNGVLHSIRRRTGHRQISVESETQLSISSDLIDSSIDSCSVNSNKIEKRSSSKRKADESNFTPVKKRLLSQSCETCFLSSTNQLYGNQSHSDSVGPSKDSSYVTPVDTTFPEKNIFSPLQSTKTSKTKTKYKRFFSPGKLIRKQKNVDKTRIDLNNMQISEVCAEKQLTRVFQPFVSQSSIGFDSKTSNDSQHFECSTVPLINFANPHVIPFGKTENLNEFNWNFSSIEKDLEEKSIHGPEVVLNHTGSEEKINIAREMLCYALKTRRSLTDTDLSRLKKDETRENSPKKRSIPVKTKSLRRGKPNTINTGLPLNSPFKTLNNCDFKIFKYDNESIIEAKTSSTGITPMIVDDFSPKIEPVQPIIVEMHAKICENTTELENIGDERLSVSNPNVNFRHRSNSPCVPLTKKTHDLLANAGLIEDDVKSAPNDVSVDRRMSWRPAGEVLNDASSTPTSCTRPSLLVLKTEKAGFVSANVRKYNEITKKFENDKTPRSFRISATKTPESITKTRILSSSARCNSFSVTPTGPSRISGLRSVSSSPILTSNRTPLKTRNEIRIPNVVSPLFKTPVLPPNSTKRRNQRVIQKSSPLTPILTK